MSSFLLISFSSVLILVLAIMSSFFRNSIFTDSGLGFGLAFLLFCEIAAGAGSDGVEFTGDVVGLNVKEAVVLGWNDAADSERGCIIVVVLTGIDVDKGSRGVVDEDDKSWWRKNTYASCSTWYVFWRNSQG